MCRRRLGSFLFLCVFVYTRQVSCTEGESLENEKPMYKYRYQSEASTVPIRGYSVEEGGYYPAETGIIGSVATAPGFIGGGGAGLIGGGAGLGLHGGAGLIGAGPGLIGAGGGGLIGAGGGGAGLGLAGAGLGIGGGGIGLGGAGIGLGSAGLGVGGGGIGLGGAGLGAGGIGLHGGLGYGGIGGGQFIGGGGIGGGGIGAGGIGIGGGGLYGAGYGGSAVGHDQYSKGHKNLNNANFEKAGGSQGAQYNNGGGGYVNGNSGIVDSKGEKGYYQNLAGGNNLAQDGKHYSGGQNYNQKGINQGELKEQEGHKKGHRIKGYKSTHHKDESGKTEEFYDEAHDEGSKSNVAGQAGAFGKKGESSFKGAHEDGKYNKAEVAKSGHSNNAHQLKKENGEVGKYGHNKHGQQGSVYGLNKGIDAQSLLGHQENSKFYKHNSVPFYSHI